MYSYMNKEIWKEKSVTLRCANLMWNRPLQLRLTRSYKSVVTFNTVHMSLHCHALHLDSNHYSHLYVDLSFKEVGTRSCKCCDIQLNSHELAPPLTPWQQSLFLCAKMAFCQYYLPQLLKCDVFPWVSCHLISPILTRTSSNLVVS